jgi:hypothetical protein
MKGKVSAPPPPSQPPLHNTLQSPPAAIALVLDVLRNTLVGDGGEAAAEALREEAEALLHKLAVRGAAMSNKRTRTLDVPALTPLPSPLPQLFSPVCGPRHSSPRNGQRRPRRRRHLPRCAPAHLALEADVV